jgi:choline dehydrogenase
VGDSGNVDFLVYLRGNPEDFDNWAINTKDSSWKYDNLLPHFQRAEDIVSPTLLAVRKS